MTTMRCKCGCKVTDGINGTVSPPPPWGGSASAYCYACENREMDAHDRQQIVQSAESAMRAGRFDCL